MKIKQVKEVCKEYGKFLDGIGVKLKKRLKAKTRRGRLSHIRYMCDTVANSDDFKGNEPANVEKAMRWLGFIQGTLNAYGFFTIDQMKEDNR